MTDYFVFESNLVCCTTRYYLDKKNCFLVYGCTYRTRDEDDARGIDWRGFLVLLFHVESAILPYSSTPFKQRTCMRRNIG